MSPARFPLRWRVLAIAVMLGACRARTPPAPLVDWKPGPGTRAEVAALLLLDKEGLAKVVCLPGRTQERQLFPGVALERILDVSWKEGPMVAGWVAASDNAPEGLGDELVLVAPHSDPRRLAKRVRVARFSPDAAALAYEVAEPGNSDADVAPTTVFVLDLATGKVTKLGALTDPQWEAGGKHLFATEFRAAGRAVGKDRQALAGQRTSLRVRWDRESGSITMDGPGSSQLPAPVGTAVAWSEEQRNTGPAKPCVVLLSRRGGVRHSIVGSFCMGIADDRGVRWSPDGRWLAFPHPGSPGQRKPGGFFVDVVSIEGGRYPALSALQSRASPEQLVIATAPGSVWFDWSPSGRFLALHDGLSDLRVYDFEMQGTAYLGKGQQPMWSPGGAYLLILAAGQVAGIDGIPSSQRRQAAESPDLKAFVLSGVAPAARIDLGQVRDARWLPAQACENLPL